MPFHRKRSARCARSVRGLTLAALLGALFGATVTAQQSTGTASTVTLVDGGKPREVQTLAKTVGEMLAQEKAFLRFEDRCSVPFATPLADGLRVVVTRVETKTVTERVPIPFPTRQRLTPSLRAGVRQVAQAGKNGERLKTLLETYKDGKLAQRKKVAEQVTPPRARVVLAGAPTQLASRGYFAGRDAIHMVATGYGPGPRSNGRWANRTASGMRPGYGVVAVDPRFIRLGTRLYIEGYGHAVAGDTGGAIKGNRIDLGYNTHREAVRVGRKRVRVRLLK